MNATSTKTILQLLLWCAALVCIVPLAHAAVYDFYLEDFKGTG